MYLASILLISLVVVVLRRSSDPGVRRWAQVVAGLLVLQILVGALNVWLDEYEALIVVHLGLGTLLWASAVSLTLQLYPAPQPVAERAPRARAVTA
jgi:heme A synthase